MICNDCGAYVYAESTHKRFHDILNDHAIAIALTLTAHVSENRHDLYDLYDRVRAKWSAEAFKEVTGLVAGGDSPTPEPDDGEWTVRIPADPEKRAALAKFAGLTEDEKAALDQWCYIEEQKRQRGVLMHETEAGDSPTPPTIRRHDVEFDGDPALDNDLDWE